LVVVTNRAKKLSLQDVKLEDKLKYSVFGRFDLGILLQ